MRGRGAKQVFGRFLSGVEAEWPCLKYLGFGFYYAWILVCYSSNVLFSFSNEEAETSLQSLMYIVSTFSLALMLIVAAIFRKRFSRFVGSTSFVNVASLIATLGTFLVFWTGLSGVASPLFYVGCSITGLATAFVALRFGMLHSLMPTSKVITYIAGSFLIAGVLYFVIIGIPAVLSIIFTALLPFLAALATLTLNYSTVKEGIVAKAAGKTASHVDTLSREGAQVGGVRWSDEAADAGARVGGGAAGAGTASAADGNVGAGVSGGAGAPVVGGAGTVAGDAGARVMSDAGTASGGAGRVGSSNLPPKFFGSLIVTITIFAVIAGFYTGLGDEFTEEIGFSVVGSANAVAVFIVIVAAVILLAINCAVSQRFNLSRLYYPIIIFACCCVVIIPLFGYGMVQYALIRSAYTLFILFVWCLLTHTAHWSYLGSTLVFGLGRGASAFGSAVGWMVAMLFGSVFHDNFTLMVALSAVMVLVLAGVSMVVLREDAIRAVFSWSDDAIGRSTSDSSDRLGVGEANLDADVAESDTYYEGTEDAAIEQLSSRFAQMSAREDEWIHVCNDIANEHGLTNREREVLLLLGRRMTIEWIADELCVSFNTAKSHVRHVYDKVGVHSRKELFALIDQITQAK